jgi:hypothetical protein
MFNAAAVEMKWCLRGNSQRMKLRMKLFEEAVEERPCVEFDGFREEGNEI